MGILDSKTRIVDVVMTPNGRAALAQGGLSVAYASFTDGQSYYDPSSVSGSYDTAVSRIYLEAPSSLPQDTLSLITDDTGKLIPAIAFGSSGNSGGVEVGSDGSVYIVGSGKVTGYQTGSSFSSAVTGITNMFQSAYSQNCIIGSAAPLDDVSIFSINPSTASFTVPPIVSSLQVASINTADSIFFDRKFANLPQFKFLPPVIENNGKEENLGQFSNLKQFNSYPYSLIKSEIIGTDKKPVKQRADIEFEQTSNSNDIVLQLYEITNAGITKLDAVDYGEVIDTDDSDHARKRIVFFGKVFIDDTETPTYINLFTVVLD